MQLPTSEPTQSEKAALFARLHSEPKPFLMPNPWDIATARMMKALGYEAIATTSAGFAFSRGEWDGAGAISREQAIEHVREIADATVLPVSADLENGYADAPDAVAETVRMAAEAGAVGCSIEDIQTEADSRPYDAEAAVDRISAAVEAAKALPFKFTLTARADGVLMKGYDLDEAIRRIQAFAAAGADVVYIPGLQNRAEIERVCACVEAPVNHVIGLGAAGETFSTLGQAGVRRISFGGSLSRVALGSVLRAAREARDGTFSVMENDFDWRPIFTALKQGKPHRVDD